MATGCGVTIETLPGYMSGVPNPHTEVLRQRAQGPDRRKVQQAFRHGPRDAHDRRDDFGDVATLMPLVHFYTGGYTGSLHNPDVRVTDEYLAYVVTAKIFALTAYRLMKDGAAAAKENIADYKPRMTKAEYLDFMESMLTTETVEPTPLPIVGK